VQELAALDQVVASAVEKKSLQAAAAAAASEKQGKTAAGEAQCGRSTCQLAADACFAVLKQPMVPMPLLDWLKPTAHVQATADRHQMIEQWSVQVFLLRDAVQASLAPVMI
jgi:hypothetical protein